jgi:hypothetical protein
MRSIDRETFFCALRYFLIKNEIIDISRYAKKIIQEQISEFNQQLGFIHELRCIITDEEGNTEVKIRLSRWIQKLIMGINCRHLTEEWNNSV